MNRIPQLTDALTVDLLINRPEEPEKPKKKVVYYMAVLNGVPIRDKNNKLILLQRKQNFRYKIITLIDTLYFKRYLWPNRNSTDWMTIRNNAFEESENIYDRLVENGTIQIVEYLE